ncbi:SpaA isopeptide-forming pilin-related protein [Enterococcus sp. HY326]|uniref:SpaA isopeptide-forming pilin-related protein n=1 Tax=Enterococcus sp. HY326 TaxID=2971265 RepID=UPI002240D2CF|nr:VWA domain-containing protein [Enterococcus sp. HY326]
MKKRIAAFLLIFAIFLPYSQGIASVVSYERTIAEEQLTIQVDSSDSQTVLDEDYATVTASFIETKTDYQWTVEFEKKASKTAGRLRIAIDNNALADSGFGSVSNIRGEGLMTSQEDHEQLATMKAANDESDLDWYYSEGFSTLTKKGKLYFTLSKTVTEGELPLVVAVDQEESQVVKESKTASTVKAETTTETKEDETQVEGQTKSSIESSSDQNIQQDLQQNLILPTNLAPFSESDPFPYQYAEDEGNKQRRYPLISTNNYDTANDFSKDGTYTGIQGELYNILGDIVSDEDSITDNTIVAGGANWRNYDYTASQEAETANGFAKNIQLWGSEQTFSNSYLDYGGAYMKKWVEPITDHVAGNQDDTTIYNVYIDIIGGTIKEQLPIDVVFVLDRSSSMATTINGVRKDNAMKTALTSTITKLFNTAGLDIRVGLVDFGSEGVDRVKSSELALTNNRETVLKSPVLTNQAYNNSGTPLSLGINKGYEVLYRDNGSAGRNPEKVLIVVGDGTPTFSYSGFRTNTSSSASFDKWTVAAQAANYWTNDTGNSFIRNYETQANNNLTSSFAANELYPTEFATSERPSNTNRRYYRYGEETNTTVSGYWYGSGNATTNSYNKANAVQTIAYHHWKRDKMAEEYGITPRVYSIGIGLNGNQSGDSGIQDALGCNVLKNIADLKPESEVTNASENSYYYGADSQEELVDALTQIVSKFETTITNATLYDATGLNVSLYNPGNASEITYWHLDENDNNGETTKYKEPVEWVESQHGIQPDVVAHPTAYEPEGSIEKNHAYRFDGISLGEGDMVRIRYQAKLDDSAQNGNFYTVNDEAYLVNEKDYQNEETQKTNRMYIPAPSIRFIGKERNLHLKKTDEHGNGISGITLGLYEKNEKGEYELIEYMLTDTEGLASSKKQFSSEDNQIYPTYYVKEISGPAYYQLMDDYLAFTIRKEIASEGEVLNHFELVEPTSGEYGEDENSENVWKGYYQGDNHTFTIVQTLTDPTEGGYQEFDHLYVNLDLVNQMKPIQIEINKVIEGTNTGLPNAEFELLQENKETGEYKVIGKGISDDLGKVTFSNENQPVYLKEALNEKFTNFRIVETKAPDGYAKPGPDDYWNVRLNYQDKQIEYQQNGAGENEWERSKYADLLNEDESLIQLNFDISNQMTNRDFKIRKVDQNGIAITGVGFELVRKEDVNQEYFKAYSGINGFDDSSGLILNETGTGVFYAKNRETAEKYRDLNFERRLQLMPGTYTVTEVDGLLGYTVAQTEFEFTLNTDGTFTFNGDATLGEGYQYELSTVEEEKILTLSVKNELQLALEFQKIDSHTQRPLEGATFEYVRLTDSNEDLGNPSRLTNPPENSALHQLEPLELGKYKIYEVATPEGYRSVPGHIVLEVSQQESNKIVDGELVEKGQISGKLTYFDDAGLEIENSQQLVNLTEVTDEVGNITKLVVSFDVENDPTFPLPATGGNGRTIFTLIAASLFGVMLLIGLYYVYRNQRRRRS